MSSGSPTVVLAVNPSRASFYFEDVVMTFQSQFTGMEQRVRRFGRWRGRMEWTYLDRQQAYAILRHFSRFNMGEAFLFYDPVRQDPNGDVTATVLSTEVTTVGSPGIKVNGANQVGRAINVKDIPNRASDKVLLRAGDLITFDDTNQMVEVYADFMGTGTTTGTIQLSQYIRKSPGANVVIQVQTPTVRMRLASPAVPDVGDGTSQFGFSIEVIEALS